MYKTTYIFIKINYYVKNKNISKLSEILQNGDLNAFVNLIESEALTLHAMMMTSNPYFILMKPNTLKIIEKIWEYRKNTSSHICFTLDAGANVHVLFPEKEKDVRRITMNVTLAYPEDRAIAHWDYADHINILRTSDLIAFCQNNQYICDYVGFGAMNLE